MNILVINWQDRKNPFGGGAEVHLHEIFSRVAGRGHSVTLACCAVDGEPTEEVLDSMRVIRHGNRNIFNFIVPSLYKRLRKETQFDIVIDDLNKIPFYTPLFVHEPLLGIAHHLFGKSIFVEAGAIAGSYVHLAEKLIAPVYKNTPFSVVSESTLKEFLEIGFTREQLTVIPNCIDPTTFSMEVGEKHPKPTVAYFGRLKKYKSVQHLLQAFAIVKRNIPDAQLHVLGKGDYQPELESLARELTIDSETTFFGYVSEEQKRDLLGQAHLVVNPSVKEGWGITNIEANACGTPIVSADSPGLRDSVAVGRSGLLYDYGNVHQLAEQITKVLTQESFRATLSKGAVSWAKEFDWNTSASSMISLCEKVIAYHNQ